jgi:hypothetical protein
MKGRGVGGAYVLAGRDGAGFAVAGRIGVERCGVGAGGVESSGFLDLFEGRGSEGV